MIRSDSERNAGRRDGELAVITRRTFLRSAASALATTTIMGLMPVSEGEGDPSLLQVLSVRHAWAASSSAQYEFRIVSKNEVGIHVDDVSPLETGGKAEPVPGATVILTSLCPDATRKTAEAETDDDGNVIFDLTGMCFVDDKGEPRNGLYECYCELQVKSPKSRSHMMREFSTGKIFVEGATGITVGTHAIDDMSVYAERITFNDWDIHYSDNTFFQSASNDKAHKIAIRLLGADGNVSVTLQDKAGKAWGGEKLTETATYDRGTGLATATFEREFLHRGEKYCLPEGETTLRFTYSYGGKKYWVDVVVKTMKAPIEKAPENTTLAPMFGDPDEGLSATIPVGVPGLENVNVSCWTPRLPLQVQFSPTRLILTVGADIVKGDTGEFQQRDEYGEPILNGWKDGPADYFKNKYESMYDEGRAAIRKMAADGGFIQKDGSVQRSKFTEKASWTISAAALLGLEWLLDDDDQYTEVYHGTLQLVAQAGLSFSYSIQTLLGGYVPAFVSFSLSLTARSAMTLATTFAKAKDSDNLPLTHAEWSVDDFDPIAINLRLAFTVSLGIGVKDFLSCGVSGTLAMTMFVGFISTKAITENKANPHCVIGCEAMIEIFAQFIVFKASATLASLKETLEDNWPPEGNAGLPRETGEEVWKHGKPRFMFTHPGESEKRHTILCSPVDGMPSNEVMYDTLVMVTNDELGASVEARAIRRDEGLLLSARDEARASRPVIHRDKAVHLTVADDGTVTAELVDCPGAIAFARNDAQDASDDAPLGAAAVGVAAAAEVGEADAVEAEVLDAAAEGQDATVDAPLGAEVPADEGAVGAPEDDDLLLGDPLFGFGEVPVEEYDYEVSSSAAGREAFRSDGIALADHGGIKPLLDAPIFTETFSDPHQRVAVITGTTYLFRVMTVEYPSAGEPKRRTRVTASAYNANTGTWGAPKVIEYSSNDPNLPRSDIFDYDFDIITRPSDAPLWYDGSAACLVVTGGLRPVEEDTDSYQSRDYVYKVFTSPTISMVLLDANLNVRLCSVAPGAKYLGDDLKHMVVSPRIVDRCGPAGISGVFVISFIRRSASTAAGIMASDALVSFSVGRCSVVDNLFSFEYKPLFEDVELDSTVSSMDLTLVGDDAAPSFRVALLFRYDAGYDIFTGEMDRSGDLSSFTVRRNVHSGDILPGLVSWPGTGHAPFLFTHQSTVNDPDPHLYEGSYSYDVVDASGLTESTVDLEGFDGGAFGVSPKGTYLYYIDSRVGGAGDEIDPVTGKATPVDDDIYRIKASKLIEGKFTDSFEFCELDHPVDTLLPILFEGSGSTFITSEITDADKSQATIGHIFVPHAIAAEIDGFRPRDHFVCAGRPCVFVLTLRNHGNVVISGFDVDLIDPDAGNAVVSTAHVGELDPSKMSLNTQSRNWSAAAEEADAKAAMGILGAQAESAGWPLGDQDKFTELSPSLSKGQLMPGKAVDYEVTFQIPEEWDGEEHKKVIVRVHDAWASEDLLASSGIEAPLMTGFHKGKEGELSILSVTGEGVLVDPEEGWTTDGADDPDDPDDPVNPKPTPKPSPNPKPSPSPTPSRGQADSRTLPSTDDPLAFTGPLSMVLGGMGAGLVAYGARRKLVEREEWERRHGRREESEEWPS